MRHSHTRARTQVTDPALVSGAQFRSAHRFPAVCWYNADRGNVMCRSAQPCPGLGNRFNTHDEDLIAAYAHNTRAVCASRGRQSDASFFMIFDARSNMAATGNSLAGKVGVGLGSLIQWRL